MKIALDDAIALASVMLCGASLSMFAVMFAGVV